MERTFKLKRDYYCCGRFLYKKNTVTIVPGFTVLCGCNGSGKSTMLFQIRNELNEEKIEYVFFDNLSQGGHFARERAGFLGDVDFLTESWLSSEGENIMLNLGKMAREIRHYVESMNKVGQKELWIIMDAIDSGFSIDNIVEFKEDLVKTVLEDQKDKDVFFLVSANEYEMARNENCLDTPGCRYRKFKNYESYRKYIINTRKRKDSQLTKPQKEKKSNAKST